MLLGWANSARFELMRPFIYWESGRSVSFLSLAITPVKEILHWARLVQVRRIIGVAAFAYALAHLLLYVAEQAFDLAAVVGEIASRSFLTIGFVALAGLSILAATSTDDMMKYLGGRRWRRLHRLTYAIAVAATLHYLQQSLLGEREPMVMVGFLYWLLFYRILGAFLVHTPIGLFSVTLMSVFAAALTALTEAGLVTLGSGVGIERVLVLNFSLKLGVRSAWMAAIPGIVLACAGVVPRYRALVGLKATGGSARRPTSPRRGPRATRGTFLAFGNVLSRLLAAADLEIAIIKTACVMRLQAAVSKTSCDLKAGRQRQRASRASDRRKPSQDDDQDR